MESLGAKLPGTNVQEALRQILAQFSSLSPEKFALDKACGLVLAEPLVCSVQHPSEDTSAMDGYAVKAENLAQASGKNPIALTLLEDISAGNAPRFKVVSGTASRISTGALLPEGADSVVMREMSELLDDGSVRFQAPTPLGNHIRFAGEHLRVGEEVLVPGTIMNAAELGMAAFLGKGEVSCIPRVKVAVLATGSELVAAQSGRVLKRGQIHDSNSIALAAAARELGCEVTMRACVPDDQKELDKALEEAFSRARIVLTSGGISAGWHDLVRGRIEHLGGEFDFHKLRMRPGKPLAFGSCGGANFFCLPGNPVSSLVTFEVFVKPALLKLMGRTPVTKARTAILAEPISKRAGYTIFFRGELDEAVSPPQVRLTGPQGSHMLRSLVKANVLIRTEETDEHLAAGSEVHVLPYNFV